MVEGFVQTETTDDVTLSKDRLRPIPSSNDDVLQPPTPSADSKLPPVPSASGKDAHAEVDPPRSLSENNNSHPSLATLSDAQTSTSAAVVTISKTVLPGEATAKLYGKVSGKTLRKSKKSSDQDHDSDSASDSNNDKYDDDNTSTTRETLARGLADHEPREAANGTRSEPTYKEAVRYVVQDEDILGKITKTKKHDQPPRNKETGEVPILEHLTVRKLDRFGDSVDKTIYLKILSPMLINALRTVVKYGNEDLHLDVVKIAQPYRLLYSHLKELEAFKTQHSDSHAADYREKCNRHIDYLLRFLEENDDGGIRMEMSRWERSPPMATFKHLWLLLRPGELVYIRREGSLEPYMIHAVDGGISKGKAAAYKVGVWNMDFDGALFGRSSASVEIKPFGGELDITGLRVFPVRFHKEFESLKKRHIKRGKTFFETVQRVSFKEYNGRPVQGSKREYERTRIMIDYERVPWDDSSQPENFHKPVLGGFPYDTAISATCFCDACEKAQGASIQRSQPVYSNWNWIDPKEERTLTDEQYMLCSRVVYGYILKERQWRMLDIEHVRDPTFDKDIMESLVLDQPTKGIIKAICSEFSASKTPRKGYSADVIAGKGEGRVCLLHGKPGVGKTLTAECVAEFTKRPLLSITAGDVGTDSEKVEANLTRYFKWAEDWRAILLLDEADIYLERRGRMELERNSVVSVFLRALEYSQGIFFITTNRVGILDEAFKSRIHISIHCKGFDEKSRQQLWENNFKKLRKDMENVKWEYDVENFVRYDPRVQELAWNGRQIRNCFQTAVTLAGHEATGNESNTVTLKKSHLEQVMEMSQAFEDYLVNVHRGNTDSVLAHDLELRYDSDDESTTPRKSRPALKLVSRRGGRG